MTLKLHIDDSMADFKVNREQVEAVIDALKITQVENIYIEARNTLEPGQLGYTESLTSNNTSFRIVITPSIFDYLFNTCENGKPCNPNLTIIHELTHVKQLQGKDKRMMNRKYRTETELNGYENNWFEKNARWHASHLQNKFHTVSQA